MCVMTVGKNEFCVSQLYFYMTFSESFVEVKKTIKLPASNYRCLSYDGCTGKLLHCALASCGAVYCNRSCLWICDSGWAGGVRTLLQPARAQCLRLSERFFIYLFVISPIQIGTTINYKSVFRVAANFKFKQDIHT